MNHKTENLVFKRVKNSRELLKEDEVVFYLQDDKIYTPDFESLEKVLNGFGFKFFPLKVKERKKAENVKYLNLFRDHYGNYLVVESRKDEIKLELIPEVEMKLSGILTNRYAFLYGKGRERKIDLIHYISFYPRNDFSKFLLRVLDSSDKRIEYIV